MRTHNRIKELINLVSNICFSALSALTTVAVTFLTEVLHFDSMRSGLVFLTVTLSTIPGSIFAGILMHATKSPIFCIKVCLIVFIVVNFVAFLTLKSPESSSLVWIYAILWGFTLGWYYPTELNVYSTLMPKGQESELSGFYLYCTQVLVWLPPLVFTIMNESDIPLNWGGVQLNFYIFLSLIFYQMMPSSWIDCVEISSTENKITKERHTIKEIRENP